MLFCVAGNAVANAGVAQLVERHLAKVNVEGPSPFARSIYFKSSPLPQNHLSDEFGRYGLSRVAKRTDYERFSDHFHAGSGGGAF